MTRRAGRYRKRTWASLLGWLRERKTLTPSLISENPEAKEILVLEKLAFQMTIEPTKMPSPSISSAGLILRGNYGIWQRVGSSVKERKRSEEHTSELQSHVNLVCRL